ncbi:MAG: GNAT family N-acetyltransferase [Peptostreptococcaceae bacterium]
MLYECDLNENIINFLKQDLIQNLNIFGVLENSKEAKLYTDDKVNPNGALVNNGYFNYMYTKNDEFIEEVLKTLEKGEEYGFSGVSTYIANKIKPRYEIEWQNLCGLYYYDKNTEIKIVEDKSINTSSINIEDAEIVNDYYTYKGEDSIHFIKEAISNRPSRCVYKDKEIVSWLLIHEDNSLGPMYTKSEYRNENLATYVTINLIKELIKNNKTPYLHIVKGNKASDKLATKCGFKLYGECDWFGIVIP